MALDSYDKHSELLTADSNIGDGKRTTVYSACVLSGASAGTLVLRAGTTDAGTIWISKLCTASTTDIVDFGPEGIVFPAGVFYDHDTGKTTSVVLTLRRDAA